MSCTANPGHRLSLQRILTAVILCGIATVASADGTGNTPSKTLTEKLEKYKYQQGEPVDYINNYELDGWNYIDRTHIVIHTGPSRDYLVTVMTPCNDLSTAENIAFTTTTSKLTKFDKLMVRGAGGIVQHCPITQINTLKKKTE
ncbi:MAG: DUF6491 family protein [Spongiibacteraceae bacterium]